MKDLKQIIANEIITLMIAKALSPQEEAILAVLTERWSDKEIKQSEIAASPQWIKACPLQQEGTAVNTTTRKIRKVVRDLRVKHRLPILHNDKGHYLPETVHDLEDFMGRLEVEAKSRVVSTMETYKVMKECLGVSSDALEEFNVIGSQLVRRVSNGQF